MARGLWWGTEGSNDPAWTSASPVCPHRKRHPLKINAGPVPTKCLFEMKYQATTCEGEPAALEHSFAEQPFTDERAVGGNSNFLGGADQRSRAAAL